MLGPLILLLLANQIIDRWDRYGADASMTWMRDGTCGDCARLHHAVPEKLIKVVESMEMRNKYPILTLGKLEELFEAAPWNHE